MSLQLRLLVLGGLFTLFVHSSCSCGSRQAIIQKTISKDELAHQQRLLRSQKPKSHVRVDDQLEQRSPNGSTATSTSGGIAAIASAANAKNTKALAFTDRLGQRCGETGHIPYTPKSLALESQPLPQALIADRCEGIKSLGERFLVTTTYNSPVDWIQKEIAVPSFIYYADGVNETHKHVNVGRESMGYLTFIAEYYNCLPQVTLFAHPHRTSYHSFQSLQKTLKLVQWEEIPGYAMMHPYGANWADCNPSDPVSNLGQPLTSDEQLKKVPCDQVLNNTAFDYWPVWEYRRAQWIAKAWDLFFGRTVLGGIPRRLRMALTAEFFVRKERILGRPREFYLQAIQWISDAVKAEELTDWEIGVVFEMLWHYMFHEPAYMPSLTVDPCVLYKCEMASN